MPHALDGAVAAIARDGPGRFWHRIASMMLIEDWRPIAEAKQDGTPVMVYVAEKDGLPAFKCITAYHPDAGWCVDELREATHFTRCRRTPARKGR
jgi:hypothetical protein